MSTWIKDNKSIASVIGVGALAFIGLTSFAVMKTMDANAINDEFLSTKDKIATAAQKAQTPTAKVLDQRKADLEAYELCINDIQAAYAPYVPKDQELETIDPEQVRLNLHKVVNAFKVKAKDQGARLNEGFNLGFEAYVTAPALQQATGVLQYELGAINWLADQALDCDITEIVRIYREKLPIETAVNPAATDTKKGSAKKAAGKTAKLDNPDLYQVLPISITLKGGRQSVNKFINAVIDSEKYLFTIQAIRCLNEKNTALSIKEQPKAKKSDAQGGGGGSFDFGAALQQDKAKAANQPAAAIAEEIVTPVVGSEKVDFHVVLNLILFNPDNAEAAQAAKASKSGKSIKK